MEKQHPEVEKIAVFAKRRRIPLVLSNERCLVNLTPKVNENDFVFFKDENDCCCVAKVVKVLDRFAHVIRYIRSDELPSDVNLAADTGATIEFHKSELIEDGLKSEKISLNAICGRCTILNAHDNDSVEEMVKLKKMGRMAYVCRYKLVKETTYKLVPVSCEEK